MFTSIRTPLLSGDTEQVVKVRMILVHLLKVIGIQFVCPVGAPKNQHTLIEIILFKEFLDHTAERCDTRSRSKKEIIEISCIFWQDRKSTRLNSSHVASSYAV